MMQVGKSVIYRSQFASKVSDLNASDQHTDIITFC